MLTRRPVTVCQELENCCQVPASTRPSYIRLPKTLDLTRIQASETQLQRFNFKSSNIFRFGTLLATWEGVPVRLPILAGVLTFQALFGRLPHQSQSTEASRLDGLKRTSQTIQSTEYLEESGGKTNGL
jgi:hypothetical protein